MDYSFLWGACYPKAKEAYDKGYYHESTSLCFNFINATLRVNLYLKACIDTSSITAADALKDYLLNSKNAIGLKISDRNLYDEARRKRIIEKDFLGELHGLHTDRNAIFHRLFLSSKNVDIELKKLAANYLEAAKKSHEIYQDLEIQMGEKGLVLYPLVRRKDGSVNLANKADMTNKNESDQKEISPICISEQAKAMVDAAETIEDNHSG